MPLPKCVTVSPDSGFPRPEGRYIGRRVTYSGRVKRKELRDTMVSSVPGWTVLPLASEINWSGRLWKDEAIEKADAWEETKKFISQREVQKLADVAFVMWDTDRINLIGVHPACVGLGLAERLIRSTCGNNVIAGTYKDNVAACLLYEKLGMELIAAREVFHQ